MSRAIHPAAFGPAGAKRLTIGSRLSSSPAPIFCAIWQFTDRHLVVIDECGSNLNLTLLWARAPRRQRAFGTVLRNTPVNTTLIAALTVDGIGPSLMVQGPVDTAVFITYFEPVLAPTLRSGQIGILDNLRVHTSPRVQQCLATCGDEVWFLPLYSLDLSPIERAFAKLRQALRRGGARTHAALETAVTTALDSISVADTRAFFKPLWLLYSTRLRAIALHIALCHTLEHVVATRYIGT